jgi:hypothetical protein
VITIAPSAPEDVAVLDESSDDLLDLDALSLDLANTQPSASKRGEDAPTATASAAAEDAPMEIVDDLDLLAEAAEVAEADLEGIEIEANGDPAQPTELLSGAESLFDHGADLSRYHHDDE